MLKQLGFALMSLALAAGSVPSQDANTIVQNAISPMGDVRSIQLSGTGHLASLGQAYNAVLKPGAIDSGSASLILSPAIALTGTCVQFGGIE